MKTAPSFIVWQFHSFHSRSYPISH